MKLVDFISENLSKMNEIETTFVDNPAAKMIFTYKIFNPNNEVVCTGKTIQVFVHKEGELSLNLPPFFEQWKRKVGLLK